MTHDRFSSDSPILVVFVTHMHRITSVNIVYFLLWLCSFSVARTRYMDHLKKELKGIADAGTYKRERVIITQQV